MQATVQDDDKVYLRIKKDVKQLEGRSVKIGFWGDEEVDGVAVVDYATYNEFGTSTIPPRPFMQTTFDNNLDEMNKFITFLVRDIIDGKTKVDRALRVMGMEYQKRMRMTIRNATEWAEPNAPETIKQKGSSSPLIDTGRMINAINYEVS